MPNFAVPRPVVHLPELPSHEEVLRQQKRARTQGQCPESVTEVDQDLEGNAASHQTPPRFVSCSSSSQNEERSRHTSGSVSRQQLSLAEASSAQTLQGRPKFETTRQFGKSAMHMLAPCTIEASAVGFGHSTEDQSMYPRDNGRNLLKRLTRRRWKRAVDTALDASPMRSMLSHFSPSRFQREIVDSDSSHQMPDLLVPAHSISLANLWSKLHNKDVDTTLRIADLAGSNNHCMSCGCHTWELPHMGHVVCSSATSDARLVAILTGVPRGLCINRRNCRAYAKDMLAK
eukprot:jgi/Ulvmu1/5210/UM022_0003.1